MSVIPRITLWGMYEYDETLFNQITFPDGIDKDVFIKSLIIEHGESPVLYPSIDFNKKAFGVWSEKWQHSFSRLVRAFTEDYNPLHNFDRNEDYEDTEIRQNESGEKGTSYTDANSKTNGTTDTQTTQNTGTENTVSAYNSTTYQPDTKTDQTGSGTSGTNEERETSTSDSTRTNVDRTGKEDRTLKHTAHLYGNIGVTKSQEMLLDELNLRSTHNLYDALIEIFANEFLLAIY